MAIRESFSTPEEINTGTPPSKRILAVFAHGEYNKMVHGPLIAEEIRIETIRRACPLFNDWVAHLEAWISEPEPQKQVA